MTRAALKTTTNVRKDVRIGKKTTTVRMHPAVWDRFVEIAREGGDSISVLTARVRDEYAYRPGDDLSQAIIDFVQLRSGNQPIVRHATREAWLAALVDLMRPVFAKRGYPLPAKVTCTMGFPSTGWRGKRRGEYWLTRMCGTGHGEIFIHPCETSVKDIVNILTHELCHAAQEEYQVNVKGKDRDTLKLGHGKDFKTIGEALDMEGKPKHMLGGETWWAWAEEFVDQCGPIPFDPLTAFAAQPKKQTTRMLKFEHVECRGLDEGNYVWRASAKGISDKPKVSCPCCGTKIENEHFGEGEESEEGEGA